jgi:hypothetical protein
MRQVSLTDGRNGWQPHAVFLVLAAMCSPQKTARSAYFFRTIRRQIARGISCPKENARLWRELELASPRGAIAGSILLHLIQLSQNRAHPTLENAIRLVRPQLRPWFQEMAPYWHRDLHLGHSPTPRRRIQAIFHEYRPVSHLWAALIHSEQHERKDTWPSSLETLPGFLSYASAFMELGLRLRFRAVGHEPFLDAQTVVRFRVPDRSLHPTRLVAYRLESMQQSFLSEQHARSPLN